MMVTGGALWYWMSSDQLDELLAAATLLLGVGLVIYASLAIHRERHRQG